MGNPLSFLHVSRPEIDLPPGTDPHADEVYSQAADNFAALRLAAPSRDRRRAAVLRLPPDDGRAHADGRRRVLLGGRVRPRPDPEAREDAGRTRKTIGRVIMLAIGAQTGPVFLTYRASAAIDAIVQRYGHEPPLFDFSPPTASGTRCGASRRRTMRRSSTGFAAVPALYIADGHHRAASAARARQALAAQGPASGIASWRWRSRTTRCRCCPTTAWSATSTGYAPRRSSTRCARAPRFATAGPATPAARGRSRCGSPARGHTLSLRPRRNARRRCARARGSDAAPRHHRRPHRHRASTSSAASAAPRSSSGWSTPASRAVAFSMFPSRLDDLMRIADAGGIMPPKSTWFEPKLRDGLLSHLIS